MQQTIGIIGGGPAGLMAAEIAAVAGIAVTVYERKPSVGRKFLMAGRGGLNLTHSEALEAFIERYESSDARNWLKPLIEHFTPQQMREWSAGLGQKTFVGTSGRIFPESIKASPLLRAWRERLEAAGVRILTHHTWEGWDQNGNLLFHDAHSTAKKVKHDAVLLALGGASWPKLGSDGGWVDRLKQRTIDITPLQAANSGFVVPWSDIFKERFAGTPIKPVELSFGGKTVPGELMISEQGLEGGVIYALSCLLRNSITRDGKAVFHIDLKPGLAEADLVKKLRTPRRTESFTNYLRKETGLSPSALGILREMGGKDIQSMTPETLASLIKSLPVETSATTSIERAISTAGGIKLAELDENMMLKKIPGVFAAGEMLDWEAPTGGYLLQATFSTAVKAAEGMILWLKKQKL